MAEAYLTDEDGIITRAFGTALDAKDDAEVRRYLREHIDVLRKSPRAGIRSVLNRFVGVAATAIGDLHFVQLFVEYGGDINAYDTASRDRVIREGVILTAVGRGHPQIVKWLLQHGAIINTEWDGKITSFTLNAAATNASLEEVQLLVEHGASINGLSFNDLSTLDFAEMYGNKEVAAFLRFLAL